MINRCKVKQEIPEKAYLAGWHIQPISYHHDNKQKKRQTNTYTE